VYNLYTVDEEPEPLDWQLLSCVLDSFEYRPWTLRELEARHGDAEVVLASLRRLNRYGLIDRMGFYVIASRSAIFYHHLLQRFVAESSPDASTSTPPDCLDG
jgi:hypothetical protein